MLLDSAGVLERAAIAVAALLALLTGAAWAGEEREARSCRELAAALNDASVSWVQLMPLPGGYNCSAEDIPPHSIVVARGREVVLEGAGSEPVYVDFNRVMEQALIGDNGFVRARNIWHDDCLIPQLPYLCFYAMLPGGRIEYDSIQISDPTCLKAKYSKAIEMLMWVPSRAGGTAARWSIRTTGRSTSRTRAGGASRARTWLRPSRPLSAWSMSRSPAPETSPTHCPTVSGTHRPSAHCVPQAPRWRPCMQALETPHACWLSAGGSA
ncbi:hypothetical protein ABPG75_002991 [Micractinium tetrahymenae]